MSRKNKTLRAFLHQNKNPTVEQAWDAAWKHTQKTFHARSMQGMEKQIADLQAECEKLVEALEKIAQSCDSGRHDGLPEDGPALSDVEAWLVANDALAVHRKGDE